HMTELSQALSELGIWVRLHYVYPYPHVDDVIPLMAEGLILPYLDVPFQHASPNILKSMKRPASSENNLARIKAWREICPEITLRSTFITGFPGETEVDFNLLLEFLEEAQLDRVGCFAYSAVDGAKANELPNQVPEEIKQERLSRFMEIQERISAAKLEKKVGSIQTVLVDELATDNQDNIIAIARTKADAPEIDGVVYLQDADGLNPGDFVDVKVIAANGHDLVAGPP
ncbi:MAG TPA: radical SAM protein, partial [Methylophilaceae bacterium]|nr:radical SAM protein [Methylophilaceae bacterium]